MLCIDIEFTNDGAIAVLYSNFPQMNCSVWPGSWIGITIFVASGVGLPAMG